MKPLRLLLIAVLLLLLVLVGLLTRALFKPEASAPAPVAVVAEPPAAREVILYFAAPSGDHLLGETREIAECQQETDCLAALVRALIAGPRGTLLPVLPASTRLHGVSVEESLVRLDFSPALQQGHPGGSEAELLTSYALANTLAANFAHLRRIQLLVDGSPIETIKGHVDLRLPLAADFSYTRTASDAPAPGADAVGELIERHGREE